MSAIDHSIKHIEVDLSVNSLYALMWPRVLCSDIIYVPDKHNMCVCAAYKKVTF